MTFYDVLGEFGHLMDSEDYDFESRARLIVRDTTRGRGAAGAGRRQLHRPGSWELFGDRELTPVKGGTKRSSTQCDEGRAPRCGFR